MSRSPIPAWLDRDAYPFEPRSLDLPDGRLSYVDEGPRDAAPVVFVHGNPSWSFMYRRQILDLRGGYRCLAPDHLGFGLSEKPPGASYRPQDHAARLSRWAAELGLSGVHLVVHDWGGPIGLSWAIDHPDRIRSLTILNTWLWSLVGNSEAERFSKTLGGWPMQFAIRRWNAFPRFLMPRAFHDRALFKAVARQYSAPFQSAADRHGVAEFPQQVIGAGRWLAELWDDRAALQGLPMRLVWALRDPVFRKAALVRWREAFPEARLDKIPEVGHYVAEEMGSRLSPLLEEHFAAAANS